MEKIIPAFEQSLFDPTLIDACFDIAELGIDSLLDDGVFSDIPIVKTLIGLGKTAQNIHDRNLLRQTIMFLKSLNDGSLSEDRKNKYTEKLRSNPIFAEEELGRVIIFLNSTVDLKKSEILAKFYRARVVERIEWDTFCELSDVLSRMFISDIELLFEINNDIIKDTNQCEAYRADRLISLGLLYSTPKSVAFVNQGGRTYLYVSTNNLGRLFCELGQ